MYPTKYHRPASVEEAVAVLTAAEEGKILAGGMTLLPTMKQHLAAPSDLIDVHRISGLSGITVSGRTVTIGAATTHAEVAASTELAAVCPVLNVVAGGIGDPAVRHMGTIGGSVANNDPAADYPAACLGLGATIVTNEREIAADAFFTGLFSTALGETEIITAVRFTAPDRAGYAKFPNPASRYALVGVLAARREGDARVAVTGAGEDGVFRVPSLEQLLGQGWTADGFDQVEIDDSGLMSDIHASAQYRAHLIKVMAKRAVEAG